MASTASERVDGWRAPLMCTTEAEVLVTYPKISIQGLDRYTDEGTRILMHVSLDVEAGQIVGIIGPSGSGKSTILRAINRLWEPPADTIFLDGHDITEQSVVSIRRRCGMLFQTPTLFDEESLRYNLVGLKRPRVAELLSTPLHLYLSDLPDVRDTRFIALPSSLVVVLPGTVAENIKYGPSLAGEKLTDKRIEQLLLAADLDPSFASKSVIGLSVGQAQRVALARTLANEPEILLLDEPTSALDPISTKHIEESVLHLNRTQNLTVLFVSHSLDQVRRLADVVCLVANGEILEVLKPSDLASAQHPVVQEFIAAAA